MKKLITLLTVAVATVVSLTVSESARGRSREAVEWVSAIWEFDDAGDRSVEQIRREIAENSRNWQDVQDKAVALRAAYQSQWDRATEEARYCLHNQKELTIAFRRGEDTQFPVHWLGEWYDRADLLAQLEKLIVAEEQIQQRMTAFRKAIDEADASREEAEQKLARNQLHSDLVPASRLMDDREQAAEHDHLPGNRLLDEATKTPDPVRTLEEIRRDAAQLDEARRRHETLDKLLSDGVSATAPHVDAEK